MLIETYPDSQFLISASALADRLDDVTLIDLRPAENFACGHINGARHLDNYGMFLKDTSSAPLEAFLSIFQSLFAARGVSGDRTVVVYDHESGERAAHAAWPLRMFDHPDVRLLDGGSAAWINSGRPLEPVRSAIRPVDPTKAAAPSSSTFTNGRRFEVLATRFDVAKAIDEDDAVIVDVRRPAEHEGVEKRGLHAGTIPGAIHSFWRDHLDEHGAYRPAEAVRSIYEAKGITPDKTIITFCQGGYRSANTFVVLKALGYPRVRNYIGSWAEWGNRDDTQTLMPG